MRKQIAAANWKMNLTLAEGQQLIKELTAEPQELQNDQLVIFAVPFPYLIPIQQMLQGKKNIYVAAQNIASTNNGAYTGEVSAAMLQSINIKFAVIGHSERREYYNETNEMLAEKVNRALEQNIDPIFCCGEPLSIRETESQNGYVEQQLRKSLFHLSADKMKNFIIAYEPIWAIGTGKTASAQQAEDMHSHIRSVIEKQYGSEIAASVSILYGGSVKAANASDIFSRPDVDGGLVGGASLVAKEFAAIINSLKS